MMVFTCPCGKRLLVKDDCPAAQGVCPGCGQLFNLASIDPTEPAELRSEADHGTTPADPAWQEIQPLQSAPAADSGGPRRYRPLYSPRTVAVATLLGGWPAGCLLLAGNYGKLHRKGAAWLAALLGFAGAGLVFALVLSFVHVPAQLGAAQVLAPLFAVQLLVPGALLYAAARVLQGAAFADHLAHGGKAGSVGSLVPLCLFVTGLTFFLQAVLTYPMTWDGTGGSLVFGSNERLFYTDGVSLSQAHRLGDKLRDYRLFDGEGIKTIIVLRSDTGLTIRVFTESPEPDPRSAELLWQDARRCGDNDRDYYQVLCRQISRDIFASEPVEILLHDLSGVPLRSARAIGDEVPDGMAR